MKAFLLRLFGYPRMRVRKESLEFPERMKFDAAVAGVRKQIGCAPEDLRAVPYVSPREPKKVTNIEYLVRKTWTLGRFTFNSWKRQQTVPEYTSVADKVWLGTG